MVVVWAIALLGFLAASLGSRGVWALELTSRMRQQLEASYVAVAAAEQAMDALDADATPHWDGFLDGWAGPAERFSDQPFGQGRFSIAYPDPGAQESRRFGLIDEERFLNLNTAPIPVLQRLFRQTGGLKEDEAEAVAESIEDWRDEDHETQPYGAESFYYLGLADSYECKDGPFENVEELRLVKGVTAKVFERVAPHVTVYGSGKVNLNTAGSEVLGALGLSPQGVNGFRFYRDGPDGQPGTADDLVLDSIGSLASTLGSVLSNDDLNALLRLDQKKLVTVKSEEFRAIIDARTEDSDHEAHVRCVLTRHGDVRAWEEW